ncbi:hypothetical protein [Streptomyces sp. NPDC058335]
MSDSTMPTPAPAARAASTRDQGSTDGTSDDTADKPIPVATD